MIELRKKFENLSDIKIYLQYCRYDEGRDMYDSVKAHIDEYEYHTNFVNGAWWAYQEQQNKIRFKDSCVKNLKLQLENKHIDCEISDACCLRLRTKLDDILNIVHKHQYSNGERILKEVKTIYDK